MDLPDSPDSPAPASPPPDSLCLIRLSAIGDCVHTLPVVRTLQSAWPHTRITWIVGRTELGLLEGATGIEFISFDKSHPWRSLKHIRRTLRGRRFDVLLHMHASMRANEVSLLVPARRRIGFDRARARDWQWLFTREKIPPVAGEHVMDGLFGFARQLGVQQRELRWDFAIAPADREFARTLRAGKGPVCAISPCSSQRFRNFRNWRASHYAEVARHLLDAHDATIVLTGGPTELERTYAADISARLDGRCQNLIGKTSLKQLLAILEASDLLICPDSGPAHMAGAVGTPVVGLYATSNRHRTGPYFSQDLVVDRYPEAVRQEFDKRVADLRWGERVRNPGAMDLIPVADVIASAEAALAGGRRPPAGAATQG